MRRTVHPSRPSANTCCRFSSFKTLAIPAENHTGSPTVNVPSVSPPYGRFSGVHIWPVLGVHRGRGSLFSKSSRSSGGDGYRRSQPEAIQSFPKDIMLRSDDGINPVPTPGRAAQTRITAGARSSDPPEEATRAGGRNLPGEPAFEISESIGLAQGLPWFRDYGKQRSHALVGKPSQEIDRVVCRRVASETV